MNVRVPGDKSVTQRALVLAALADGESRLEGLLHGGDAESTAEALRALGATIPPLPRDGGTITVRGLGLRGLRPPRRELDLGNSGTGARLLLGVLAGAGVEATLTGDASLRGRPMARVTEPLTRMGARFDFEACAGRLPIRVHGGGRLRPLEWESPVASAQVKSALLLAGLVSGAFVLLTEPRRSRDHTERMLRAVGVSIVEHAGAGGWRVEMRDPPDRIAPLAMRVPGDPSSAAFLLALGALGAAGAQGVTVQGVGLNPTRTAFFEVLRRMGAEIEIRRDEIASAGAGEPVGDVAVQPSSLRGVVVEGDDVPSLIDELPLVAALGARAEGVTTIRGAQELRAKESDRIHAMAHNLQRLGVEVEERHDGLSVVGSTRPLAGRIEPFGDHRIAMSFSVLASLSSSAIEVDGSDVADVSFPGFATTVARLTGRLGS